MTSMKRLRAYARRPTAVEALLLLLAIFFLTLALMQLPKGPMPDSPGMPGPSNSALW